jgi:hypothetical protein
VLGFRHSVSLARLRRIVFELSLISPITEHAFMAQLQYFLFTQYLLKSVIDLVIIDCFSFFRESLHLEGKIFDRSYGGEPPQDKEFSAMVIHTNSILRPYENLLQTGNLLLYLQQEERSRLPFDLHDLPMTSSQEYGWLVTKAVPTFR